MQSSLPVSPHACVTVQSRIQHESRCGLTICRLEHSITFPSCSDQTPAVPISTLPLKIYGCNFGRDLRAPAAPGDLRGALAAVDGFPSLAQLAAIALLPLSAVPARSCSCTCSWGGGYRPRRSSSSRLGGRPASLPVADAPSAKLPASLLVAALATLCRLVRSRSHSSCRATPPRSASAGSWISNSSSVEPVPESSRRHPAALRRGRRQHKLR
jgi:hypothetical protein